MSHQTKLKPKLNKPSYHHGDLRSTLLSTADSLLKETDIEGLSLRKLATRLGCLAPLPTITLKVKTNYCVLSPNKVLCAGNRMLYLFSIKLG